jgi:hypothetical protein
MTDARDQAGAADVLAVYGRTAPASARDLRPEVAGIHPVSAGARFGSAWSQLTLWFTPNVEVSGLFIATIAAGLGLGFGWGLTVLLVGEIAGTLVFAWMVIMGPRAGVSQLALARMPFGRSVVLPALIQALTAGGWIALVSLFGAQATSLLFGIPFAAAAAIVLAAIAVIAAFGYQWIHQVEGWFAPVMTVLFGYLTYRILRHHITLPVQTVHGAALAGAVLLMLAIVLSGSLSWCPYAADFARRLPEGTSSRRWLMRSATAAGRWPGCWRPGGRGSAACGKPPGSVTRPGWRSSWPVIRHRPAMTSMTSMTSMRRFTRPATAGSGGWLSICWPGAQTSTPARDMRTASPRSRSRATPTPGARSSSTGSPGWVQPKVRPDVLLACVPVTDTGRVQPFG